MIIKCTFCGKQLRVQGGDNPGQGDPQPFNRGFFENFYNGTVYDDCYKEKKDKGEEIQQYLDKFTRNWPRKKNVPTLLEDDQGISTETKTDGVVKKSFVYYKCPHCARTYFKSLNSLKDKVAFQPDPSSMDMDKVENDVNLGTSSRDTTSNSPYKNVNDFNRGNSAIDSDRPAPKKKIKFRRH